MWEQLFESLLLSILTKLIYWQIGRFAKARDAKSKNQGYRECVICHDESAPECNLCICCDRGLALLLKPHE